MARTIRGVAIALAALTAGALPAVGHAQTKLYLSEYQFQNARMRSVGLDGSNPLTLFTLPPALWLQIGMTVEPSSGKLVWIDSAGASEVMRSNVNGSSLETVAPIAGFARGASIDAQGRIFYATDNRIERVNANGTGKAVVYPNGNGVLHMPRVDRTNGHVYFGERGRILRMNTDGTNVKEITRGVSTPRSVTLDIARGYLYWIDTDTISDHVARCRLDGTGFRVLYDLSYLVGQSSGMSEIILDPASNTLYWADELTGHVWRGDADGGGATVIYTSGVGFNCAGMTFDTGEPVQPMMDCDGNGISDAVDIANGAPDCDDNGWLDACQADPCPPRVFLLDQGSDALNSQGRNIGFPSRWQIFQPFDVPAGGWDIREIGLDGFLVTYVADPAGSIVKLFPHNPSTGFPDETAEIASAFIDFRFSTDLVTWQDAPLAASLAEGRYWVRVEARDPVNYWGVMNYGFSGLGSYSRSGAGNWTTIAPPIALRLVQGPPICPADFNGDGFVTGDDFDQYVAAFELGNPSADFNADGFVSGDDFDLFVTAFEGGC